jgi:hypothetical protein
MYETDIQSNVSRQIIDGEVGSLKLAITDNERAVIVNIGDADAAYTADEARDLAQALKCISDQRWESDNDMIIDYLRDLADVVDNKKTVEEIEQKNTNINVSTQ